MFVPSPQQAAFIEEAKSGTSSIVLVAVAGAGKTTTILQAVQKMRGSSIILAFNKKIAEEIKSKLQKAGVDWKKAEASTVHAIGLRNYRKTFPNVRVVQDKVANITSSWIESGRIGPELQPHTAVICQLVSLAKQNGVGIIGQGHIDDTSIWDDIVEHFDLFDDEQTAKKADDIVDMAIEVLKESNKESVIIDFDDMIYLPLLYQIRFFTYDNVIIDEAQDTNTIRRLLAACLMKHNARLFAVGDPHQAIYGFTGADNDSLDIIKDTFKAKEMPLTVTYRCPKNVVKFAQNWVSHIQAHESAPAGTISLETFEQMMQNREKLNADAAILCRNTRPLVTAAFRLIREKIPCRIEGRDIGEALKKLATRWKSCQTTADLEEKLEEWVEREKEKWLPRKKMAKVQEAEDKFETLKVIMDACREDKQDTVQAVVAYIDNIFADNVAGILTLSTIHKSKGREWKRVYWLDRFNTCPSKYATLDWEKEQESNLCYVAATRSMGELIELFPPMPKVQPVNDNNKQQPAEKAA
ncbi:UvrD-helicase domain-containing protein [Bradyrhizobium erythrophlei]|jgi:DNA helicase-2/ATP-dependent DNA helicase PcrA|uniref:DNA 3'-5' helicase n=1 Tax=Bradyrhizobium erythrophlei TaxID=1437360 RepID=A0A1M5PQY3_9BRAD|nr:ATP-dependent helicase [Bradyrhizobium erythrophlei]SHH04132.1 AAA domain-containing protein [Bradyrhizobium erythrophlei]